MSSSNSSSNDETAGSGSSDDETSPVVLPHEAPEVGDSTTTLDDLEWSHVEEDDSGKAKGVFGKSFASFSAKQLRTICSRLQIKGVKNKKKSEMVEAIVGMHENKKQYEALRQDVMPPNAINDSAQPRKEIQCGFRLLNILFSDDFAEDFANIGNANSRELLDAGMAANNQFFWDAVQKAFVDTTPNDDYDLAHTSPLEVIL